MACNRAAEGVELNPGDVEKSIDEMKKAGVRTVYQSICKTTFEKKALFQTFFKNIQVFEGAGELYKKVPQKSAHTQKHFKETLS